MQTDMTSPIVHSFCEVRIKTVACARWNCKVIPVSKARRRRGEMEVKFYAFLSSVLDVVEL